MASGPRISVYTVGGNLLWGPQAVAPGFRAAELMERLDRPLGRVDQRRSLAVGGLLLSLASSPFRRRRSRMAFGDQRLDPEKDLSELPDGAEVFVHFEQVKVFDHSFARALIRLAERSEMEEDEEKARLLVEELWKSHESKIVREGVSFTTMQGDPLIDKLNTWIDAVRDSMPADYHPGSEGVVRDIVHPSLYPYVKGASGHGDLSDVTAPHLTAERGKGGYAGGKGGHSPVTDFWGRPYEASGYQWLPSEVSVDASGKCRFETYINNLPADHSELYEALGQLLSRCLPQLEASYAFAKVVEGVVDPDEEEDPDESDCSAGDPKALEAASLKGRKLQVIVKIVDYQVGPGLCHEGVWHVEGMSHEQILATAEVVLRRDAALEGGDLEFRRGYSSSEASSLTLNFPQMRPEGFDEVVERGLVPLGRLSLPAGRVASWPNSHVHRLSELRNAGDGPSARRIAVFWLVNPEVRIISTQHVSEQQQLRSRDWALQHRLALMEERKFHKQSWNIRRVGLCEH
ncbi:unnamed protein product [Effrenium voratum]|nr:unnamed protein product [Effrenium voratum]